jgi:membrane protease YdiL (CAAX protease family)
VALTALVWASINAACEQLSWLYVLDAWRNRWRSGWRRWLGLIVGIALIVTLVGLIHVLFWIRFLPTGEPTAWSWLVVPINSVMTGAFALLYYRSRSLWPTFVVHLLLDLQLVLIPLYSILPDL